MSIILSVYDHLKDNAALWIALTLIAYLFGQWVFCTAKFNPLLSPIIVAVLSIMSLLLIFGVPYEQYFSGLNLSISCWGLLLLPSLYQFMNNVNV